MTEPCARCGGTGLEFDHKAVGAELRHIRKMKGMSLRGAASRMSLTASYISDLELGRRNWNETLISRYEEAMECIDGDSE